jgi:hypothetical protein
MIGRHLHQAAGDVYGVAGRRDVAEASTAQPGGNNRPEVGANLESKS